jgi:hypothetical protein
MVILALPLWWVLFPKNAWRFYRWFHGRTGMDQRRLDAMTPRQFRIAGAFFVALVLAIGLFGKR